MRRRRRPTMPITIAALRETAANERRVAITPETAKKYKARGLRVLLERGAGERAGFRDDAYADAQCAEANEVLAQTDILLCVQPPDDARVASMKSGALLVGQLRPHGANERLHAY